MIYKMRMVAILGIFTLLGNGNAFCDNNEDQDPIVVKLSTESSLLPLYLTHFIDGASGFAPGYLSQLERVLQFDLGHNGSTSLVPFSADKESLATSSAVDNLGNAVEWKNNRVFYVVKARVENKTLKAYMLAVNSNIKKSTEGITLTGNLSEDRRQIHILADTIHKVLFGVDGVANTRILYTVKPVATKEKGQNTVSEVWESDYDGQNSRQVTKDGAFSVSPSYIPAKPGYVSGNFFYVSYKFGQPKIFIGSLLNNNQPNRLTLLPGIQLMPTLSRQRDKVAFISDITGNPELFMIKFSPEEGAVGKPQQLFSAKHATQSSPSFSPDGRKIAFVSNKDGSPRVYIMNIPEPGTSIKDVKATLISKKNRENTAPAWSPDGNKIAYCCLTKGTRQIWVYDFNTNEERQLTQGSGNKENPSWAPNSLHLVFNSTDSNASDLYLINLNQPESVRISSGVGERHFPSWETRLK